MRTTCGAKRSRNWTSWFSSFWSHASWDGSWHEGRCTAWVSYSRTAKAISSGAFNSRAPLKGKKNELDELAATFNTMVDRIQALVKGMKEVTDSVAHDLRTPVTRMRVLAESHPGGAQVE